MALGVAVWIVAELLAGLSAWNSVGRVAATPEGKRAAGGSGYNTLMVGSDNRAGLTAEQRRKLGTGSDPGARTDSIMVLHAGSGKPTLLSIPRDSYVEIPGHGLNKINAAFSIGGPKLLAATIEHNANLRIDGYMAIGFGGFAEVVDAVGGVRICVKKPMNDPKAHINLAKGCQELSGKKALGYVRSRYANNSGDLGRVQRQREFLGALLGKIATPSNALLPWRLHSLGKATGSAITIGEDDSMYQTMRAVLALRTISQDGGYSVTVPLDNVNLPTPAGEAVHWDPKLAPQLFGQIRDDQPLTIAPSQS